MGYFSDNSPESFDEEHLVVARFFEHMLKVADDNCHEICEMDTPRVVQNKGFDELFDNEDSAVKVVGVGIYPILSLFNNCCDVNTLKYHLKSVKWIRLE